MKGYTELLKATSWNSLGGLQLPTSFLFSKSKCTYKKKKESPFSLIFLFWIPQHLLEKNSMCHVKMYYQLLFVSKMLSDTAPVWWEIQSNCSLWSCMTLLFSTLVSLFHVEILVSGISAALLYIFWCPVYGGPIRKTNGAQCMSTSTVYRRAKWWFLSCFLAPFLEIASFLFTFWVLSFER